MKKEKYNLNSYFQEIYNNKQDNNLTESINNITEESEQIDKVIVESALNDLNELETKINLLKSELSKLEESAYGKMTNILKHVGRNKKAYAALAAGGLIGDTVGEYKGVKKGFALGKDSGTKEWQQKIKDIINTSPEDARRVDKEKKEEKPFWKRVLAKEISEIIED